MSFGDVGYAGAAVAPLVVVGLVTLTGLCLSASSMASMSLTRGTRFAVRIMSCAAGVVLVINSFILSWHWAVAAAAVLALCSCVNFVCCCNDSSTPGGGNILNMCDSFSDSAACAAALLASAVLSLASGSADRHGGDRIFAYVLYFLGFVLQSGTCYALLLLNMGKFAGHSDTGNYNPLRGGGGGGRRDCYDCCCPSCPRTARCLL